MPRTIDVLLTWNEIEALTAACADTLRAIERARTTFGEKGVSQRERTIERHLRTAREKLDHAAP